MNVTCLWRGARRRPGWGDTPVNRWAIAQTHRSIASFVHQQRLYQSICGRWCTLFNSDRAKLCFFQTSSTMMALWRVTRLTYVDPGQKKA
nr:hypothetical protein Q903MT_gene3698 [Picea sitchensis]